MMNIVNTDECRKIYVLNVLMRFKVHFRPNRSALQAVPKNQEYINEGYAFVIDLDLEKFFDKVNHDLVIARLSRKISDSSTL